MSKNPFSSSNRMLVAVSVSAALHGLFFCLPFGPLSKTVVLPSVSAVPISVRLVSSSSIRESRASEAPVRSPSPAKPEIPARPAPEDPVERPPAPELSPDRSAVESPAADAPFETSAPDESTSADASVSESTAAEVPAEEEQAVSDADESEPSGPSGPREVSFSEVSEGLDLPAPEYPKIAKRWGLEGTVRVRIVIAPDGGIFDAEVVSSSGQDVLDAACLRTVRKRWRFRPTGGDRVATAYDFRFELK